jgi:hypothetical protein
MVPAVQHNSCSPLILFQYWYLSKLHVCCVSLQAQDLAALACTCTPLRHLASVDPLWEPLTKAEFPQTTSSSATRAEAGRKGWKWVFGAEWLRCKALQRARARAIYHVQQAPGFPYPFPGLGPGRRPFHPPGIIGGDYDRLPQGFIGGGMTPGFMVGGGGLQGGIVPGGGLMGPGGMGGLQGGLPGGIPGRGGGPGRRGMGNFRLY